MIVLGVDPGTNHTGYGVIEVARGRERLVACGTLHLKPTEDHQTRLKQIYDGLTDVADRYPPDEAAVEMPVYGQNPQSMLKLGRAQAAAMLVALNRGVPVTQYTPTEVKKAVTGTGAATKEQVWKMVASILKVEDRVGYDASDALAVALCHAHRATLGAGPRHAGWAAFLKANPGRVKG